MAPSTAKTYARILLPVLIGLGVTAWLFTDEFSWEAVASIDWSWRIAAGIAIAAVFVVGRDFGLAWRFHTIASPTLSWKQAVRTDLMCAFTSAITPSAMGGSAFAIFYLNREGVTLGRATTMTLTTLFLDEMFFVIFCPVIMLLMPMDTLFGARDTAFLEGVRITFWLVYAGVVAWAAILFMGIIVKPRYVSRLIKRLFMWRYLRRWRRGAFATANNMVMASGDLRHVGRRWWARVFCATAISWFSRYLIVNALFWAFVPGSSMLTVFSRQFVVWVMLMVAPTPGGSGVSEWLFTEYYGDMIGNTSVALVLALSWRLLSYYIYLIIGTGLLPVYLKTRRQVNPSTS